MSETLGDILAAALDGKAKVNDRAPNGLKTLKATVTDFFTNPQKFLDFSTTAYHPSYYFEGRGYENALAVRCASFEDATGLVKLGSGSYSDVYAIDETRVLKIVKSQDTGYARFAEFARKHASNPHFPKIYYSGVWGGKTVYVLERLTSRPATGDHTLQRYFVDAIFAKRNNPFMGHATKHIAEISEILNEHNLTGDIHGDNVMFRGDVPVVTDPCAE